MLIIIYYITIIYNIIEINYHHDIYIDMKTIN